MMINGQFTAISMRRSLLALVSRSLLAFVGLFLVFVGKF
jgi:hypothetical protein